MIALGSKEEGGGKSSEAGNGKPAVPLSAGWAERGERQRSLPSFLPTSGPTDVTVCDEGTTWGEVRVVEPCVMNNRRLRLGCRGTEV